MANLLNSYVTKKFKALNFVKGTQKIYNIKLLFLHNLLVFRLLILQKSHGKQ